MLHVSTRDAPRFRVAVPNVAIANCRALLHRRLGLCTRLFRKAGNLSGPESNTRCQKPMHQSQIVCHRGACKLAPENTIASGALAASLGADFVELDVRQSRDGVLYVLHDATLDRTTNATGPIAEQYSGYLDRLDAGSWFGSEFAEEPLPRLDAFLAALRDRVAFYIEIKSAEPTDVTRAIRTAGVDENCFVYSESAEIRQKIVSQTPWLKRMLNWRDAPDIAAAAREHGAQIIEFHAPDMVPERVDAARAEGLEIMMYTPLRDEAAFRKALSAGVNYLNVDYPELATHLRKVLQ